jgi:NAD(P)H-dependent FMN reductase
MKLRLWGAAKRNIFARGLDDPNQPESVQEIRFLAHAISWAFTPDEQSCVRKNSPDLPDDGQISRTVQGNRDRGCTDRGPHDRIAAIMSNRILVFYGSYRSDRLGIRLAHFVVEGFRSRGDDVELIDAKAVGLPMLDRMYKEYPKGAAPAALEKLASQIREADGFVFITGEYNWGVQPGLKNLTDHFLEEWFWRPAAIASYSAGRLAGAHASVAWHGTLSEMGMVVISSTITVGPIAQILSAEGQPTGEGGKALERTFPRFADDLVWWMEAAKAQRARKPPPY